MSDKLQRYVSEFLNKPIECEYCVNKLAETNLGVKFLAQLEEYSLLKFLSLNKKFNSDLIKAFYCNLTITFDSLKCQFCNKLSQIYKEIF